MDEKEFKALEKIYEIRLRKVEKVLMEKRRILKEKESTTRKRVQELQKEKEREEGLEGEAKGLIGKFIKPSDIEILRSRQARLKHDISEAQTRLKEAKTNEVKARTAVSQEAKVYQNKLFRKNNFHDAVAPLIQEQKRRQEDIQEERELAP